MRRSLSVLLGIVAAALSAPAQRHSGITSPPTAPPPPQAAPAPPAPIVPVSSGLGPLQFVQANAPEPAPEELARQLQAEDDRIRAAALAAIGAPSSYSRERVPVPHSVQVSYVALGNNGELDALVTVELDLHLVSAILIPSGSSWRRVASMTYQTPFADPSTNVGTFVRTERSLLGRDHYTAIFRALSTTPDGDVTEHEAHVNVFAGHAAVTISFASAERVCETPHLQPHTPHTECDLTERWLQTEPSLGTGGAILVTATGHVGGHEAIDPLSRTRLFDFAHTRSYECQPFQFSDESSHYEPTASSAPCFESLRPQGPPAASSKPNQAPASKPAPTAGAPQTGTTPLPERQSKGSPL